MEMTLSKSISRLRKEKFMTQEQLAEAGNFEELMQRKEYFYSLFTVSQ